MLVWSRLTEEGESKYTGKQVPDKRAIIAGKWESMCQASLASGVR
jgi:hypothetical protein